MASVGYSLLLLVCCRGIIFLVEKRDSPAKSGRLIQVGKRRWRVVLPISQGLSISEKDKKTEV